MVPGAGCHYPPELFPGILGISHLWPQSLQIPYLRNWLALTFVDLHDVQAVGLLSLISRIILSMPPRNRSATNIQIK